MTALPQVTASVSAPIAVRAEHLDSAVGLTVPNPRLSWQLPRGSAAQRAYQVRVGDWDSGWVESAESVLVHVGAPALRSRQRRIWQVRIWTDAGLSNWSKPAVIEAGLLDPADWTSAWICPAESQPAEPGHRPGHLLRGSLTVPAPVSMARVYATAHGLYELYLNGIRVGDTELAPGFTSYSHQLHVQAHDIGALLAEGENVLGAVLTDGWFRGINGMFRDADCFGDRTQFLAQVHIDYADGRSAVWGTGPQWQCRSGPIRSADLLMGMTVDLEAEPRGWAAAGFDVTGWAPVEAGSGAVSALMASPAPPVRRTEFRRPVSVTRTPSGSQVIDMGENIVGWVRLGELGPAGTETELKYAEALSPDGEANHRNLFPDHTPPGGLDVSAGQVDRVISAGRPGDLFEPRHTTHGFRYVGVSGAARDLTPEDVTGVVVHTDFRPIGSFRCSDPRLNRLHEVAVRSFLGNAVDIPTDCPTRERSAWTGDWAVFVRSAAFLFDVAGFTDKWLQDLAADQWEDGTIPNYVPDHLGERTRTHPLMGSNQGSAGWGDAAVLVPWEMYRSYGDRDLLARQWPSMVAWTERAIRMAREGRHPDRVAARPDPRPHEQFLWDTGFHFGEWLEPGVPMSWEAVQSADHSHVATAYLRLSSAVLARIAGVLGKHDAADRYRRVSAGARTAWQAEFVAADGTITPDTQATLVRALAFDLLDSQARTVAAERLAELIRAAGTHLGTGFLATPHLLTSLGDAGYLDLAYQVLLQDSPPSWLYMLEQGATTVWELWDAIDATGVAHESLNHYSKGAVIDFLHRYVAGLRSLDDGPGYRRFRVEPRPGGGLTWAEASHDGPYGRIEVSWARHADTCRLRVVTPPGSSAQVVLPDGRCAEVRPGTALFEFR